MPKKNRPAPRRFKSSPGKNRKKDITFRWALVEHPLQPGLGPQMEQWVALCAKYARELGPLPPVTVYALAKFLAKYVAAYRYYDPKQLLLVEPGNAFPLLQGSPNAAPYRSNVPGANDVNRLVRFLNWVKQSEKDYFEANVPFELVTPKTGFIPDSTSSSQSLANTRRIVGVNIGDDDTFRWALTEQRGMSGTGPQMTRWVELCSRYMQTSPSDPRNTRQALASFLYGYVARHKFYDPRVLLTEQPAEFPPYPPLRGPVNEAPFRDGTMMQGGAPAARAQNKHNSVVRFLNWVTENDSVFVGAKGVRVPFEKLLSPQKKNRYTAIAANLPLGETSVADERKSTKVRIPGFHITNDSTFQWALTAQSGLPGLGPKMERWVALCVRYLRTLKSAYNPTLIDLGKFLHSYIAVHGFYDPKQILISQNDLAFLPLVGPVGDAPFRESRSGQISQTRIIKFLVWVSKSDSAFVDKDEDGNEWPVPGIRIPFDKEIDFKAPRRLSSNKNVLPMLCITELLQQIGPGENFEDWKWAINLYAQSTSGSKSGDWFETTNPIHIAQSKIKPGEKGYDPDFVARIAPRPLWRVTTGGSLTRVKYEDVLQIWCPARTVALVTKLLLPLRSYQVRFLDSGEADIERVELHETRDDKGKIECHFIWADNSANRARLIRALPQEEQNKVSAAQGIFRRYTPAFSKDERTGFYINTNKTADIGKKGSERGYEVPWQYDVALRWLIKLRNWQEKYNPIERPGLWSELTSKHLPQKSESEISSMRPTCFLFRDASSLSGLAPRFIYADGASDKTQLKKSYGKTAPYSPETLRAAKLDATLALSDDAMPSMWAYALLHYQEELKTRGYATSSGRPFRFVHKVHKASRESAGILSFKLDYPLHSLRVSLLTAMAFDGDVDLPTLMALAGHARIVMTIYYLKESEGDIHEQLSEGTAKVLAAAPENFIKWAADRNYDEIRSSSVFVDEAVGHEILGDDPALRNLSSIVSVPDGYCLAGANTSPPAAGAVCNGCWNGGALITNNENEKKRAVMMYGSVRPRCCSEGYCRFLWTGPAQLEALKCKYNNRGYKLGEARKRYAKVDDEFRLLAGRKFDAENAGVEFDRRPYDKVAVLRERLVTDLSNIEKQLTHLSRIIAKVNTVSAISREAKDGKMHLVALGSVKETKIVLEAIESETLHLNVLCRDLVVYPEEVAENTDAVLRRSQLLDKTLTREFGKPILLQFDYDTQLEIGEKIVQAMMVMVRSEQEAMGKLLDDYQILTLTSKIIDGTADMTGPTRAAIEQTLKTALVPHPSLPGSTLKQLT